MNGRIVILQTDIRCPVCNAMHNASNNGSPPPLPKYCLTVLSYIQSMMIQKARTFLATGHSMKDLQAIPKRLKTVINH